MHRQLGVRRAAKVVSKTCADYKRTLYEADLLKRLNYPGIPTIFDIEEDKDSICIIEEYISGKSLSDYVKSQDTIDIRKIVQIAYNVCCILEYLHNCAKIIHLDIKPANIIIREKDEVADTDTPDICIIDFDSSCLINGDNLHIRTDGGETKDKTAAGAGCAGYGTPGFASPEQYEGKVSIKSDIYSVGILILYMTSGGHMQSVAAEAYKLCKLHSSSVGSVVKKCIRHNPSQRYKSITSLKNALFKILENSYKKPDILRLIASRGGYGKDKFFCLNKNHNTDKVHDIFVAGTRSGIGTTHLCFCLASFLAEKNKKAVCIRHGDGQDYRSQKIFGQRQSGGIYSVGKINIMPDYNSGIVCGLSEYEYRIHDMGSLKTVTGDKSDFEAASADKSDLEAVSGDMKNGVDCSLSSVRRKAEALGLETSENELKYILVGDYGYRRQDIRVMEEADRETILFINHISGKAFYECVKKLGENHACYRFPCMYEWNEKNALFEEAAGEIFGL